MARWAENVRLRQRCGGQSVAEGRRSPTRTHHRSARVAAKGLDPAYPRPKKGDGVFVADDHSSDDEAVGSQRVIGPALEQLT